MPRDVEVVKDKEFEERVISIDRVARVVKGGRRFRFRALVVVGDRDGQVGIGIAKAGDVTSAVAKAVAQGKRRQVSVPRSDTGSIPHEVTARFAGAKVLMKPAGPGTGVIAGGAIREVIEVAGISDLLSKALGSSSKINNAYAAMEALKQLQPLPAKKPAKAAKAKAKAKGA